MQVHSSCLLWRKCDIYTFLPQIVQFYLCCCFVGLKLMVVVFISVSESEKYVRKHIQGSCRKKVRGERGQEITGWWPTHVFKVALSLDSLSLIRLSGEWAFGAKIITSRTKILEDFFSTPVQKSILVTVVLNIAAVNGRSWKSQCPSINQFVSLLCSF